ncbi:MAG TPA: helix-turn-helix transcriptional regulator [Steroidobacteraceae bacterium]|nr:helix-turn-helix transcriptional regulator [Steroidobacteraceae bacterium]
MTTSAELEGELGLRLRELRILKNLDQKSLAERAGVSVNAIKHLESGRGARVASLIKVLRALDRADWLDALAPTVSISPMQMLKSAKREPRRARRRARVHV